ncbi:MAG: glycosyltransferase [Planctomycetales bacterium]|nr:glycosyltransferase [Planctomycetales bacterium]
MENPLIDGIANLAKQCGVRVAAVCNWEWTCPLELSWLRDVDLMICPTLHALRIMNDWKLRYGFAWQVLMVPWPIDVARFKFRLRTRCEKFVFVNGTGGVRARRGDGSLTDYRRKGVEIVFAAARGAADVPIIVYSQTTDIPSPPPNVEVRQPPSDNRLLYNDGDVCVQPSHWEGVGMQLLECQAAGMPLVTTDAAPMNEHQPLVAMPVRGRESVQLVGRAWFESCQVDPADLAGAMRQLKGKDIGRESQKARQFIEQSHCWDSARRRLCQAMVVS